jgi:hypothetical protein
MCTSQGNKQSVITIILFRKCAVMGDEVGRGDGGDKPEIYLGRQKLLAGYECMSVILSSIEQDQAARFQALLAMLQKG